MTFDSIFNEQLNGFLEPQQDAEISSYFEGFLTYMSVSNTRMSSEFSSVLSSTMSSASLLPGNSESSVKDLKKPQPNKNRDQILDTHFNVTVQCGLSNGALHPDLLYLR